MASGSGDGRQRGKEKEKEKERGREREKEKEIERTMDLVSSAKKHLRFLRHVSSFPSLQNGPVMLRAIHRYQNFWLPLAAEFYSIERTDDEYPYQKLLQPPLDVQWVWYCHCLIPRAYQKFCELNYSKLIDAPHVLNSENEESAREICKKLWRERFPQEPYNILALHSATQTEAGNIPITINPSNDLYVGLVASMMRASKFYYQISQPYMEEESFLRVAMERYKCFLYLFQTREGRNGYTPTSDIKLMWLTHKTSPQAYLRDIDALGHVVDPDELSSSNVIVFGFERTASVWEATFRHPYERAGCVFHRVELIGDGSPIQIMSESIPITINWQHQEINVNSKYELLSPRFVVEVCVQMRKGNIEIPDTFMRLRVMEAYNLLRLDTPIHLGSSSSFLLSSWERIYLMQCEIETRGLALEVRKWVTRGCIGRGRGSKLVAEMALTWEELQKSPVLALEKSFILKEKEKRESSTGARIQPVSLDISITPPVSAPYLLRSIPDRVTDDSGTMLISNAVMMRIKKNIKPQEGRWVSRTVLDHRGKECFVIRMRVAKGIWRKKERLVGVDWNERCIHLYEGGWNYISGSIGICPEKLVAIATPLPDEIEKYRMKWLFSTGEMLTIQVPIEQMEWERKLRFSIKNSSAGSIRLLNGRKMQYKVPYEVAEEEEGFITLVRYTKERPNRKATALLNWKLSAMEVLPEEDVALVMLIGTAIQATIADLGGQSLGSFFSKRWKKSKPGLKDWGALVMGVGPNIPSTLTFWYLNPTEVVDVPNLENYSIEVSPNRSDGQMYRGTSWLHVGGSGSSFYKASTSSHKGSFESLGKDGSGIVL